MFFRRHFCGFFPYFHVAVMHICNSLNMGIFAIRNPYICVFVTFAHLQHQALPAFGTHGICVDQHSGYLRHPALPAERAIAALGNSGGTEKEFLKKFLKWNILGPIFRKSRALPLYA